uniref:Uncharacterized protein n=1 Tax=Arundo donax TaxID=35708 RepID=A0A0A9F5S3_ARUDO
MPRVGKYISALRRAGPAGSEAAIWDGLRATSGGRKPRVRRRVAETEGGGGCGGGSGGRMERLERLGGRC